MDQFTLSFGETHHTESFTQFNVQNVTINQLTRSNSIDKLEIPDENVAVTRNGAISNCPIKSGIIINDANKQKVTGFSLTYLFLKAIRKAQADVK